VKTPDSHGSLRGARNAAHYLTTAFARALRNTCSVPRPAPRAGRRRRTQCRPAHVRGSDPSSSSPSPQRAAQALFERGIRDRLARLGCPACFVQAQPERTQPGHDLGRRRGASAGLLRGGGCASAGLFGGDGASAGFFGSGGGCASTSLSCGDGASAGFFGSGGASARRFF